MEQANIVLQVRDLKTYFYTVDGIVPAVDGVSFSLHEGETLAVVGESGCGKSVTSLSILRLIEKPGKIVEGEILYRGKDLVKLSERQMEKIRGNEISMIFQEPMTSLNPVFPVGYQIMESLQVHQKCDKNTAREKAIQLLGMVGLPTPEKYADNFPHQLSGGMRQRVMIAMALACSPKILIADEPTTALDVTIQAQILRLINSIQQETKTSILMITHDLGIVAQAAQSVMVMYAGQMVEYADVRTIFKNPQHPYTKGLLRSVPKLTEEQDTLYNIKGSIPSAYNYPKGCRFSPRCEHYTPACDNRVPDIVQTEPGHLVRCIHVNREK